MATNGAGSMPATAGMAPQRTYATGMGVALCGVLMFFMALVSAYIVRKGFSNDWQPLEIPRVLWLSTLILLASSFTIVRARNRLLASDDARFRRWWGITAILGIFFLVGLGVSWRQLAVGGIGVATNPSTSFFYVLTAAHGLHLLGGIGALIAIAFRAPRHLTRETATKVASIYWHAMNGLWLLLFVFLMVER
jgi:cytochrome c oxidase subunit 3